MAAPTGQPIVGVGAIVFREGKILLVKRARDPGRGLWAIPGGRLEYGETLQQATEREILEETGITIRAGEPYYTFDLIERDESGGIRFHYVIVDLLAEYVAGELQGNDEVEDLRWVGPEELGRLEVSSKTRELLQMRLGFGRPAPMDSRGVT
jgi:ADP-ribose pyrophosphatase